MSEYTFYPEFSEHVPLYRGIQKVWVGKGEEAETDPGKIGYLYVKYANDVVQEVGPATDYAIAVDLGYQGTEEEWEANVQYITENAATIEAWAEEASSDSAACAANALKSEGFAIGEQDGTAVSSGTYYQNNAKYYKEQANADATSANTNALKSEGFAVGKQNGTVVESGSTYYHNNASYFAGEASSSATSASGSATNANTDALKAEGYAVGKQNGTDVESGSVYYQNNAKYYKDQSETYYNAMSSKADKADTVLDTTLSRGRKADSTVGSGSIAFGNDAIAAGEYSCAIGGNAMALGHGSVAAGNGTIANTLGMHASGYYNHPNSIHASSSWRTDKMYYVGNKVIYYPDQYICIKSHLSSSSILPTNTSYWVSFTPSTIDTFEVVGRGTSSSRKNIRAVDTSGNEYLKGDIYVGCDDDSTGGTKLPSSSLTEDFEGTDFTLVTTGDKYNWNHMLDASTGCTYIDDMGRNSAGNIAPYYDEQTIYYEGDLCSYQAETGEEWEDETRPTWIYKRKSWGGATPASEDFDLSHWDIISVNDIIDDMKEDITTLENKIVFLAGDNPPSNPFEGMIWLKPIS